MTDEKVLVGLTGGIGSGKSVVARLLMAMGVPVYDSDSRAKKLMDTAPAIRQALSERFGAALYATGTLNRPLLAECIFSDPDAQRLVNAIVHPVVRKDFIRWAAERQSAVVAIETALLRVSGIINDVDFVLRVDAPVDLRVRRVVKRNGFSPEQVMQRIAAQCHELKPFDGEWLIINDDNTPLIPQVNQAMRKIKALNDV